MAACGDYDKRHEHCFLEGTRLCCYPYFGTIRGRSWVERHFEGKCLPGLELLSTGRA